MERKIVRRDLIVRKRRGENRVGRGFSRKELERAGISLSKALRLGLPIDVRRRTLHKENVTLAKRHMKLAQRKLQAQPKNKGSRGA